METRIKLNPKQNQALIELTKGPSNQLLFGGAAAGGKSWLGCLWLWISCRKYPESRWFIARRHLKDLDASTVTTFFKVLRAYEGQAIKDYDPAKFWRYSKQGGFILHLRNKARIDLLATEYEPTDPLFNRFGSFEFTGGWFEEAQETGRDAAGVLMTRIGRHLNLEYSLKAKALLTCNPSKGWLYTDFYRPYITGKLPPGLAVILATMKDNAANLPPEYLSRMAAIQDPTIRQRLTEGLWEWDSDSGFLIPARLVAGAIEVLKEPGPVRIGIDVGLGGPGADLTIIQVVIGNAIQDPIEISSNDYTGDPALYDDWLAGLIADIVNNYSDLEQNAVRIDCCGVGDAIAQKLKHKYGVATWPFRGSVPAYPRRGSQTKLANLRAQAYWELKEGFRLKKYNLPTNYNEKLYNELINVKYLIKNDTVILEDKGYTRRRLGCSPDRADALSMACLQLPEVVQSGQVATAGGIDRSRVSHRTRDTRPGRYVERY